MNTYQELKMKHNLTKKKNPRGLQFNLNKFTFLYIAPKLQQQLSQSALYYKVNTEQKYKATTIK